MEFVKERYHLNPTAKDITRTYWLLNAALNGQDLQTMNPTSLMEVDIAHSHYQFLSSRIQELINHWGARPQEHLVDPNHTA